MLAPVLPPPLSNLVRQRLLQMQDLPLPGHGHTLERWRILAAMGHEDLCLAKVLEAHYDATAILQELGAPLGEDQLLAVWAAEGPACTLRADGTGRLRGDKPWCSGSDLVDAALVTVRTSEGVQLYRVDAAQWHALDEDPWPATGMGRVPSTTVRFDDARAEAIGPLSAYLDRPGFWHGGAGVAAVWFGAATAVAERMQHDCSEGLRARLLGKVDLALAPAAALLRDLARSIDLAPQLSHRVQVVRVRSVVERAATQVLDLAGRALGPAPMCMEEAHARRWADLAVFMRQSHGDKDWAWLGEQCATQVMPWAL
ncbi:acyl-CoA dehydrogenase [Stenotrophomonas maltophilia]|nr:acyl-CoA dehydrogenase [Stenotrophomonas maltophilia]